MFGAKSGGKTMTRTTLSGCLALAVLVSGCALPQASAQSPEPVDAFTLAAPELPASATRHTLWSTNYYTPVYRPSADADALPLIDVKNIAISPKLARKDWCNISLQGTAMLRGEDGSATAYVYVDSKGPEQVNCDDRLGKLSDKIKVSSRKARYQKVTHPYGCGVRNMPLIPFRTIAVDSTVIPYRTVLFIPGLRGLAFELEGKTYAHDGYVFAGDRGGAIKGMHIDFFSGNQKASPFPTVIASNETKTFPAFVVPADNPVAVTLTAEHAPPC